MLRLISGLAFLVTGCAEPLDLRECERLLDHYTERLVRDEHPTAPDSLVLLKQVQAKQLAKQEPAFEFEACTDKVSRRQFECALAAVDVDGIERCLVL
jgi:hypothetical protein